MQISVGLSISSLLKLAFLPTRIPNLELWIDADLSAKTLNGSNIAQINDLSGNGRDFTAAGAAQPLYEATGWSNGTAQLDFDGSGDYLEADLGGTQIGSTTGDGFTAFFLINPDSASNSAFEYLLATDSNAHRWEWNESNNEIGYTHTSNDVFTAATPTAVEQLLTFNSLGGRSGSDSYLYLNGTAVADTGAISENVGLQSTTRIGNDLSFGRIYPGKIKAVLIYSRAFELGGVEQTLVEDYLLMRGALV